MTPDLETPSGEQLVRRLWQYLWIDRDFESLVELLADPYIRHNRDGTKSSSPAEYVVRASSMLESMRGVRIDFDQVAETGEQVWVRLTLHGVDITNACAMTIAWLSEYRIAEGRIAEVWSMHQTDLDWSDNRA